METIDMQTEIDSLWKELSDLKLEINELRVRRDGPPRKQALSRAERRHLEVCRCFRDGKGPVSVYEADEYLEKASGYCKRLVEAGLVKGIEGDARTAKRLWVDAGAVTRAVRADYL